MNEEPKVIPGEEDIAERIAGFNAALQTLLGKYELGLGAQPTVLPDGRLGANPILLSTRKPKEGAAVGGEPKADEPQAAAADEAPAPLAE